MRKSISMLSLLLAATLLAGCGGIPTGGSPVAGDPIDDDVEIEIGFAPQGPRPGSTQEEIVQDFLRAATNPQGDFAIAQQFLTTAFAEKWDPDASVLVRSSVGTTQAISETALDFTFTTSAFVDAEGHYKEQRDSNTATLTFQLVKVGEEWRISSAPDGIVLADGQLDDVFREYGLYFFDPSYDYLVPDVRWFPNQARVASRVVTQLLAGQSSWLGNGVLVSAFPAGTALGPDSVSISSGVASVDLTEEARSASNTDRDRMRQQLVTSLASLSNVSSVVITVEGTPLSVPVSGSAGANSSPEVEPLPLVGRIGGETEEFGFIIADAISPIPVMSDRVIALEARAATLARGGKRAAVLGNGGVYSVTTGDAEPVLVDGRPGLVPPSIDNGGFIWSVPRSNASALRAFQADGTEHRIASGLSSDARVISMDVSRDGARILVYLSISGSPRLYVAGITRQDGVPTGLSELQLIPVGGGAPLDATWVDDTTVATLSTADNTTAVTAWIIGGPSESVGTLRGGKALVGGNDGIDGLRVLTSDGDVYGPRGSSWQRTATASFIATQQ
jgi:hypothetical protein